MLPQPGPEKVFRINQLAMFRSHATLDVMTVLPCVIRASLVLFSSSKCGDMQHAPRLKTSNANAMHM